MVTDGIGNTLGKGVAFLRAHGLTPLREVLPPDVFHRLWPGKPRPHTILVPEVVFWLMATVAFGDGSMAGGVEAFWASLRVLLPNLRIQPVTEEAFCTARKLLPLKFFLRLFADVVHRFSAQVRPLRWKGRRLLGSDGTEVELRRRGHLAKLFPPSGNHLGRRGHPQARLVGLVGLWDGICYAFRWTNLDVGEQQSLRRMLRYLDPLDLLLLDRNFADKATLAGVRARGADCLCHMPSNRFLKLARTPTPSRRKEEWYVQIPLPPELRQPYPPSGPELRARILEYQVPGFRTSWLITTLLDTTEYSYEELVTLYHERWRQETFHLEWKHTLQLSNLRSETAKGLLKEVLVQLTINNLIRWVMAQAAPPSLRPVDLKFLEAKRLILAAVPSMTAAPVGLLPGLFRQLLDAVAKQRILVRPGRAYPRRWDARGRPKGHGKIAVPAKLPPPKEIASAPI